MAAGVKDGVWDDFYGPQDGIEEDEGETTDSLNMREHDLFIARRRAYKQGFRQGALGYNGSASTDGGVEGHSDQGTALLPSLPHLASGEGEDEGEDDDDVSKTHQRRFNSYFVTAATKSFRSSFRVAFASALRDQATRRRKAARSNRQPRRVFSSSSDSRSDDHEREIKGSTSFGEEDNVMGSHEVEKLAERVVRCEGVANDGSWEELLRVLGVSPRDDPSIYTRHVDQEGVRVNSDGQPGRKKNRNLNA